MKVCVVGAGAVGGALAVRLRQGGCDVGVVARGEHGRAIREHGLALLSGEHRHEVRLPCVEDVAELPPPDIVFVTVKQTQLPAIAAQLRRLAEGGARIVLAMNGIPWWFARELPLPADSPVLQAIDPGGVLAATLRPEALVSAVVQSSSEVVAPGVVLSTTPTRNRMILGQVTPGADGARLAAISEVLRAAGYEAIETPDIRTELWNKMTLWMAVSPIAALTGLTLDRIASDAAGFAVMCGVMHEMARLGERLGFAAAADVEGRLGFYRDKPTKPSLLKDVELGREPELASCVLVFHAVARALGCAVPYLETLATLARLRFAPGLPG
jgi:2-dehydropantoate 2-reductase